MPPPPLAHPSPGNHLIVCGDTPLAYRISRELTRRYNETVVIVVPDRTKNHGPRMSTLPGVTVLERAELTSSALREAGVATARAAALVGWDDLANFHAALRAQELNADLRIVVGADNRRLGDHITGLLRDCTVCRAASLPGRPWWRPRSAITRQPCAAVRPRPCTSPSAPTWPPTTCSAGSTSPTTWTPPRSSSRPEELNGDADLVLAVADGTPRDAPPGSAIRCCAVRSVSNGLSGSSPGVAPPRRAARNVLTG